MSGDGPAFPQHDFAPYPGGGGAGQHVVTGGMSKRDLFAAMAMQGLLASGPRYLPETAADEAVKCADALLAMLAARERDDA